MRKTLLILAVIGLILGQINIVLADDAIPHIEVTAHNTELTPGKRNEVIIRLNNTGTNDLTEIETILSSTTPSVSILSGNHKVINKILKESSANYTATIYVDQNQQIGAYTLQLQLSYIRFGRSISLTIPITVTVIKTFQPNLKFSVEQSSQSLRNGYNGNFEFNIENKDKKELRDIDITLTASSTLVAIIGESNINVEKIQPEEKMALQTQLKIINIAQAGAYSLSAIVFYSDQEGNRYKQQVIMPFEVVLKSPVIMIRNLNPTMSVTPGSIFDIDIRVECYDAMAYNTKTQLSLDQRGLITPRSPTTLSLGDLKPGDKNDIRYSLLLTGSATPGEIPITLTTRFIEPTGIQNSVTEVITVDIAEFVEFQLLEEKLFIAEQGKVAKIESDLLLVGTTKVEFSSVELVKISPFDMDVNSREYLGAIDPDSPVPFTVSFNVPSNAELGGYSVPLKVKYLDHRNSMKEKSFNISIEVVKQVTQQAQTQDEGIWGWLKTIFGLRF